MKKLNILLTFVFAIFSTSSFSQAGKLDSTFGVNGIVTTDFDKLNDMLSTMGRQTDGKIILAGASNRGGGYREFALARYNPNGSPDNSFSSDGKLTLYLGTDDSPSAIAIQSDGKIIIAGGIFNGTYADVALIRFKTDGTLDSSFNKVGYVSTSIGTKTEYARAVAILPDGKILIGGAWNDDKEFNFLFVRYNSNGKIDSSFSNDGIVTHNIGAGNDIITSMLIQPDGKIVVTGPTGFGTNASDFVVARFNPDGTFDNNFGSSGKTTTSISNEGEDYPLTILLQADGKIVIVGNSGTGTDQDIGLIRYNKNGSLDLTFGSNGIVKTDIYKSVDGAWAATLQKDEKIIITGSAHNGTKQDLLLGRYNTNGSLDNSFGKNGIQTYSLSVNHDMGNAVIIQPDEKIIVGGHSIKEGIDYYFTLSRYLSKTDLGIIDFNLLKNEVVIYPNPITDLTSLKYALQKEETITLELLDVQGKLIKTFVSNEKQFAGEYIQPVDLPDNLASGNYIIKISSPNGQMSIKILK